MRKKRNQSNSPKETSKKISSTTLHYLLRSRRLPPDFPLEQQINEFNIFCKKARVAPLNLDERLKAFAKEKNWTDDERKNFNIMGAIKVGSELVSGRMTLEDLITRKDEQGAGVEEYECRKCGSIVYQKHGAYEIPFKQRPSQTQYDRLPEDEALGTLLGQEIKRCPHCGEYVRGDMPILKKVKARTHSWEWEKYFRKGERIAARKSRRGIPLTLKQLRDLDKALHEIQENVIKEGNKLIYNRIPTESETRKLRMFARRYHKRFYEILGGRMCARPDCPNVLPQGSRASRKYCCEECRAAEKSRRARKK